MKALAELEKLLRQKTWDKEIVLWLGPDTALKDALSKYTAHELDMLDLLDPNNLPSDDNDTRERMISTLRHRLQELNTTAGKKIVLVLRSAALLARYNLGLKEFYDWFCSDFGMVVVPLAHSADETAWPEAVVFDKDRLYNYFTGTGMCSRVLTDKG